MDLGQRSNTLLIVIAICASLVGTLLAGLGVVLVYLGATGRSDLSLFGSKVASENVGVPAILIGAVVIIMVLRRILISHDVVVAPRPQPASDDNDEAVNGLFRSVGQASDIFSKRYIPRLIDELEQHQANKVADHVVLAKFTESLKRTVDELSRTFTDLTAKSSGQDDLSKNVLGVMGLGGGLLRNSLNDLYKDIAKNLEIGTPDAQIIMLVKRKLRELEKPTKGTA